MNQSYVPASASIRLNADLDDDLSSVPVYDLTAASSDFAGSLIEAGLSFEDREYPVSIRPYVLSAVDARNLGKAAETVVKVANRIPAVARSSAALREMYLTYNEFLSLLDDSQECFLCRVDGVIDAAGRFTILELNTACPGGVIQAGTAFRIWERYGQKLLFDHAGSRMFSAGSVIEPGFGTWETDYSLATDPHGFVRALVAAYRSHHGGEPSRARVVNYRGMYTNEVHHIVRGLSNIGINARLVDAAKIAVRDGQAYDMESAEPLDLIYNKLDPLALMTPGLAQYLAAWSTTSAVFMNPLSSQWLLEDKTTIAVLSDPSFRHELAVTDAENEVIDAVVPWTRLVRDGRTTGPDGDRIDLIEFACAEQRRLVLKPGNASRGDGVVFGYRASPQEWRRELARALTSPHVLQERCVPMRIKVLPPGSSDAVQMNTGIDCFLIFGRFAGFHSRASELDVMNIGRSGVLLPVHVVDRGT